MAKLILGTCEYNGLTFTVSAIPFNLFRDMLKAEKSGDPSERAEITLKVVQQCISAGGETPYDFEACPWNEIVELSKLTMARPEGAGASFTIKPAK
jgi:hypothetical protein